MKSLLTLLLGALGLTSQLACAQATEPSTSESRDAAAAFIGSMQFTVGRIGRECLASLNRKETPQDFVNVWMQRNGKYASAANKYLQVRLDEAEAKSESAKNAVMRDLASVRGNAEMGITSLYAKHGKEAACARMVALIDSGAYDITSRAPIFEELEALVAWSQKQ